MAEYDSSNTDMPRVTVIAKHNSVSYQVDGLIMGIDLDGLDLTFNHNSRRSDQPSLGDTNMYQYFY